MMRSFFFFFCISILLLTTVPLRGQGVSINDDGSDPDPSAMLEVKSADKGVLVPRMTQALPPLR